MKVPTWKRSRGKAVSGFTLIELLVVIAIVAILAAILFPVFAQAREKARQTSCLSNEKQIALGIIQYTQDFDETGPVVWAYTTGYAAEAGDAWDVRIRPYMGQQVADKAAPGLFACPSDSQLRVNEALYGHTKRSYSIASLYEFNGGPGAAQHLYPNDGVFEEVCTLSPLADYPDPAGTILIAEQHKGFNRFGRLSAGEVAAPSRPGWAGSWYNVQDTDDEQPGKTIKPVHSGGWNYAFLDGHARWYRPEQTVGSAQGGTTDYPKGMWTRLAGD
jgi:prepilin-type N-terminal cleavage/methylation domain-containing protein/prepilin-type processing-associated H-X9-DG protein